MMYSNDCASCSTKIGSKPYIESCNLDFGVSLCYDCLKEHKKVLKKSTIHANKLYFTLRARNIDARLSFEDGTKTIDIYIPNSLLHIEVDGVHHNLDEAQAFADLM